MNSQPWHFVIAASNTAKEKIVATLDGACAYNTSKVPNASHVLIMCARTNLDDATSTASWRRKADERFLEQAGIMR